VSTKTCVTVNNLVLHKALLRRRLGWHGHA